MSDHFQMVAAMIDDLRSDDSDKRINSMKGLQIVAQTLGPERTRNELLPYITEYMDDDDDVLRTMASSLGGLLAEVGGAAHVATLLLPLELMTTLDEVTVREAAVASLNDIARSLFVHAASATSSSTSTTGTAAPTGVASEAQAAYISSVHRIGESEQVNGRASAAAAMAIPLRYGNPSQRRDLRNLYQKLCDDTEVCVRRAACVAIGSSIVPVLEPSTISDFLPAFKKFVADSMDSVRVQAVIAAVALTTWCVAVTDGTGSLTQVLTAFKTLAGDTTWRVRFMSADRLGEMSTRLVTGTSRKIPDSARTTIIAVYNALLTDSEPEIRASAVFNTDTTLQIALTDDQRQAILTSACKLTVDANAHVRGSLAATLLKCAGSISNEHWTRIVLPAATTLLSDSEQSVRLSVLTGLTHVTEGVDVRRLAASLLPVIQSLFKDSCWRARESVIRQLPAVAQALGMSDDILNLITSSLTDRVASIRACGAAACQKLVENEGSSWTKTVLVPKLATLSASENFSHRVAVLHTLIVMLEPLDASTCRECVLPLVNGLLQDRVPNVRVNVARWLRQAINLKRISTADAENAISSLAGDADSDVRDVVSGTGGAAPGTSQAAALNASNNSNSRR